MDDHYPRDDGDRPSSAADERVSQNATGRVSQPVRKSTTPKTDIGTILLHWTVAIAFIVSLFTGVRIAADALIAPVSHWLVPILPQGDMWYWHFYSGLVLFFGASAYVLYVMRSGLIQRNAVKKTRVLAMNAPREMKWAAVNVVLHWAAYGLIALMFATGIMLYLGYGGWWVYVHSTAAFVGLTYIFVHIVAHFMQGGWWQLLRIFNPSRLVITRAVRPKPLLIGSIVGLGVVAAIAATDVNTRDQLVIARTSAPAPKLDGVMDDAIWKNAVPVTVHTHQGNKDAGGAESSTVQVWAAHDGQKMYYAFKWSDPTRSMRRIPMIKRQDGWHVWQGKHDRNDIADNNDFYEDKLAIGITTTPNFGGGGSTHLGPKPLGDKVAPLHARGYHYTNDGTLVDVWQWKASRGGHLGFVDDQ
jgi:cytochrome b subunit of formate dehydrogenase